MVTLQNAIYLNRENFIDPSGLPKSSFDFINEPFDARRYNGWNEVPLAAGSDPSRNRVRRIATFRGDDATATAPRR